MPLFIFAGELLSQGGVGKRIVQFARVLFGFLPGGLGVVTVVSWCAGCGVDLSVAAFSRLADLSRGRINVTVEGPVSEGETQ